MNDLTVFMPEKSSPCLPEGPIRTVGIDLGTTNSAVAEAVFDPENPQNIEVRCLEVDQPTEAGIHNNMTVPSVVALKGENAIIGRHHKLCKRFDEALIKIEDILAKDPEFPEALFLKAQILWQGFGEAEAAKQCLLKVIRIEPDKAAVFHRWSLNLYGDIQKYTYFREDDIMENSTG